MISADKVKKRKLPVGTDRLEDTDQSNSGKVSLCTLSVVYGIGVQKGRVEESLSLLPHDGVQRLSKDLPNVGACKKSRNADPGVRVQCRQKTVEDKRQCTTCNQQFCPKCLTNRYGVEQEQKAGLAPTGILATTAKSLGFASVAELLKANPDAAQAVQAAKEVKSSQASRSEDAAAEGQKRTPTKGMTKRKNVDACQEAPAGALPDQELPPRLKPMPAAQILALQKPSGQGAWWPQALPQSLALPADCAAGDLLEVLEFVQVFGHHLSCRENSAAALAAELLQNCSAGMDGQGERSSSPLGHLHIQLLSVLSKAQEEKVRVTSRNWHHELCQRFLHVAPKPDGASMTEEAAGQGLSEGRAEEAAPAAAGQGGGGGGQHVEAAMEESTTEDRLQREAAAERRKQARTDIKRLQEQEIALLIASGQGEGMTLEEQKTKLAAARAKAQGALGNAPSGEASLGSSGGSRGVRGVPLGSDREGACYWRLKAADAFGGGLLVQSGSRDSTGNEEEWGLQRDTTAVTAALDARGICEGPLKKSIIAAFPAAGAADPVASLSRAEGAPEVPVLPKSKGSRLVTKKMIGKGSRA
ncbi:hypothetical protein ABBQ38_004767 [Trebouxia sp. C0009 RCD-2024]